MKKIEEIIKKENVKTIILWTLIFMLIAHGFAYTNVLFSHDSMRTFFWTKVDTIEIGRYLIPFLIMIRGKYYPPLLIGVFTYILLVVINYLLIELFSITKKHNIIFLSGIMTTACTITLLNSTYIAFTDMDVFAVLLAIIGAYLWRNYKYGFIFAIIPTFILLPIYQPHISFFTGIVVLLLIKDILDKKDVKKILIGKSSMLTALITFLSSLLLYSLSLKVLYPIFGFTMRNSYNSVSNVANFSSLDQISNLLIGCYKQFFYYIFNPSTHYRLFISILTLLLIIIVIFICIKKLYINKSKIHEKVLFTLFIILIPFIFNFVYILGNGVEHQLMIYSFFTLYAFAIMLSETNVLKKKYYQTFLSFVLLITLFSNIIYSNECYLIKELDTRTTVTTMNRIIDRLEEMDDYEVGKTKVAFIGNMNSGPLYLQRKSIDVDGVGLLNNFGLTYYKTYEQYFENYLAYPINVIPEEEALSFKDRKEVLNMKPFPSKDSIKFVDDTLIIKLSE